MSELLEWRSEEAKAVGMKPRCLTAARTRGLNNTQERQYSSRMGWQTTRYMATPPTLKPGVDSIDRAAATGPPACTLLQPTATRCPGRGRHLESLALELIDDPSDLPEKEGPGVDEVDPVHHDDNDAVPALEAPGQAVFDEEGVAEHEPMLLIPKEDRAFSTRANLGQKHNPCRTLSSPCFNDAQSNPPAWSILSALIATVNYRVGGRTGLREENFAFISSWDQTSKENICYHEMQGPLK